MEIGSGGGNRRQAVTAWTVLAAAMVAAAVAAAGIFALIERTEEAHRAQILFLKIDELSKDLHALNLQALVVEELTPELEGEVEEENREMEEAFAGLEDLASGEEGLRPVHAALDDYRASVDEELRLIAMGRIGEARRLDEEEVAPRFGSLDEALGAAGSEYAVRAERSDAVADVGTALVLGGAALLIGQTSPKTLGSVGFLVTSGRNGPECPLRGQFWVRCKRFATA